MPEQGEKEDLQDVIPRPRIQTLSLSDLIFGLALSIGAVSLLSSRPSNVAALVSAVPLSVSAFSSFATVWLRYTGIMVVLSVSTGPIVAINVGLLFLVSIEPYLFSLMSCAPAPNQIDQDTVTSAYAIFLFSVLFFFFPIVRTEIRDHHPGDVRDTKGCGTLMGQKAREVTRS